MSKENRIKDPEFAARLQKAVAAHPAAPDGHGQQKWIHDRLQERLNVNVSPEAIRKWFHGESRPKPDMIENISRVLNVDEAWLSIGSTPVETKAEAVERNATASGATNALAGLIQMAGGHISFPDADEQFDILAIISGKAHRIEVKVAYNDPAGVATVAIAPNHERRTVILIEKTDSPLCIRAWRIPNELIANEGNHRGGHIELKVEHDSLRELVDLMDINGKEPKKR